MSGAGGGGWSPSLDSPDRPSCAPPPASRALTGPPTCRRSAPGRPADSPPVTRAPGPPGPPGPQPTWHSRAESTARASAPRRPMVPRSARSLPGVPASRVRAGAGAASGVGERLGARAVPSSRLGPGRALHIRPPPAGRGQLRGGEGRGARGGRCAGGNFRFPPLSFSPREGEGRPLPGFVCGEGGDTESVQTLRLIPRALRRRLRGRRAGEAGSPPTRRP